MYPNLHGTSRLASRLLHNSKEQVLPSQLHKPHPLVLAHVRSKSMKQPHCPRLHGCVQLTRQALAGLALQHLSWA
jgi:hypothetical protein